MARNKQHLTGRQAKFLNTLARGHMTVEQVERHLGLACYTLRRWMDQKPFLEAWAKTNTLLHLRRGADDAVLPRPTGDTPAGVPSPAAPAGAPGTSATGEDETNNDGDIDPPRPRRARDAAPPPRPKSDRDLIRLRHGEEAARAFEDLLRRHAAPTSDAASPPPAATDLPPPPAAGAMVAQPSQAATAG
jgi:hypothetical protein